MPTPDRLRGDRRALAERCRGLDGRGYPAYRDLEGGWDLGDGLTLFLDRAARDPFAPPSPVRLRLVWRQTRPASPRVFGGIRTARIVRRRFRTENE